MIKHLVFWTLLPVADGRTAEENAVLIKSRLEGLSGRIPDLLHIEVGLDFSRTDSSADVALYSEFPHREALEAYQEHPAHVAVAQFVGRVCASRLVVDYEV